MRWGIRAFGNGKRDVRRGTRGEVGRRLRCRESQAVELEDWMWREKVVGVVELGPQHLEEETDEEPS